MSSVIHLARFGSRGGAHTMLAHTGVNADLLGKIVWHTDAPPHSSDVIKPFVAGYRLGDTYIVQLTRPDDAATRPGMVATTAAIVPVAVLADLDLQVLLARLADMGADLGPPLDSAPAPLVGPHVHPAGAAALASALLARSRAAWVGSFLTDAIGCLWTHLSPADRARVVFGAAFHPDALSVPTSTRSIVAVAVPPRVAPRWSNWPTVGADSAASADSTRDALFGDDGGRAAALAHRLGTYPPLECWRHLAVAAEFLADVRDLHHESVRALLQLLGLLQPVPGVGAGPKRDAIARLAEITPAATFADVRGLRGVPWHTLPPGSTLDDLLADWACATFSDPLRGDDFADAAAENIVADGDAFQQALAAALENAADRLVPTWAAEAVLRHPRGADATSWLVRHAGSRSVLDAALADAAEAVGAVPGWVVAAAVRHRLPCVHAVTTDISDPVAAWQGHLRDVPRAAAADDILARRTGAVGTVRAALGLADAALTDRAGRLVAGQPVLLTGGDVADEAFRAVWTAATHHGADPWRFVPPADAAAPLLALVASDQPVDAALLDALSRTSAADVSRHPNRAQLWDRLPSATAARFKAATAAAFARSLCPGDPAPEPQLQVAILSSDILGAVAHDDTRQAVALLQVLSTARAEHASLVARRGRFAPGDAAELARLVVDRRWRAAAETIADLAGSRPDLQPAALRVGQLFSIVERLLRLVRFSDDVRNLATVDELRDALHEIAASIYPEGPGDNALWERAGGQNADLPDAYTGRLRWGLALHAVMRGQRGAPTLDALLESMIADYPNNDDLGVLARSLQERDGE